MSIGRRLILGFSLVLALLLLVVVVHIYEDQQQQAAAAFLTERVMPRVAAASDLETAYLFQSSGARSYILSGDEQWLADYRRGVSLAADATSRLDSLPKTPEGTAIFNEIRSLASQYDLAADSAIALRQQGKVDESMRVLTQEMLPARNSLVERTEAFVTLQTQLRDDTKAGLDQLQQDGARNSIVITVFALLIGAALAYFTANSVRRPARTLVAASARLADGDYASAIEMTGRVAGQDPESTGDEMRRLGGSFQSAAHELMARESHAAAQSRLSALLASTIDVSQLASEALREMADYAKAEVGVIYAFDQDQGLLRRAATYCCEDMAPDTMRLGDGVVGEAAVSKRTVLVKDIPADLPFKIRLGVDELPPRWIAAAPLIGHDELAGVILLGGLRGPDKITVEYLEHSARQLAVSLQNSLAHERIALLVEDLQENNEELASQNEELHAQTEEMSAQNEELQTLSDEVHSQNEELHSQNEELAAQAEELAEQNWRVANQAERIARLQEITLRLSESLSPHEVLEQVVRAATDLTGSSLASVFLLDESGERFTVAASVGLEETQGDLRWLGRKESLAGRVLSAGRTIFVEDTSTRPEIQFPLLGGRKSVGSLIVAPMIGRGEKLGVVEVYYDDRKTFTDEDVQMMSALGAAAAVAVYNSRLLEETLRQKAMVEESVQARDEFISVAAHELKTPVTSLQGFAQLVQRDLWKNGSVNPERLSRAMERIDQQSKRLTKLAEQLLNMSRLQSGKLTLTREETNLSELLGRVVTEVQQANPSRALDLRSEPGIFALVDSLRIEQVLVNLLDNAIKFSPEDSAVEVSLDKGEAGWVRMSVRDRGIGIPEDKRERIFERFYQAHAERYYGGMGIGLSVSRQIVEMHGGEILVEQPGDGGSRFVVRLPADGRRGERSIGNSSGA